MASIYESFFQYREFERKGPSLYQTTRTCLSVVPDKMNWSALGTEMLVEAISENKSTLIFVI